MKAPPSSAIVCEADAMELLQLEHFLAVVEEGTFTRAAERARRTQPAISQSIKKLEDELGMPLFTRDLHEVSLTDAGKALVVYARRMIADRDNAMRTLGALQHVSTGTLNIASHESAAIYLLPAALRHYLNAFPDIKVGIHRSRLVEIPRQVLDREMHVGFVKDRPVFKELTCVPVHADEMVMVASPAHPLARRADVTIRDLEGQPFVLHRLCSTTEQKILRLFEQHHVRCRIVAEVRSFENIKALVAEDVGLAIVPSVTVRQEIAAGTLVRVKVPELKIPRQTFMIYREQGQHSSAARELIDIVRSFNWESSSGPRVRPIRKRA
jgi:DNA-binding transcriptional LysR family regulator